MLRYWVCETAELAHRASRHWLCLDSSVFAGTVQGCTGQYKQLKTRQQARYSKEMEDTTRKATTAARTPSQRLEG